MSDELREAASKATPGPWEATEPQGHSVYVESPDGTEVANVFFHMSAGRESARADARFIAAANPAAVLALLDERDGLRARVEALADELTRLCDEADAARERQNGYGGYVEPDDVRAALSGHAGDTGEGAGA